MLVHNVDTVEGGSAMGAETMASSPPQQHPALRSHHLTDTRHGTSLLALSLNTYSPYRKIFRMTHQNMSKVCTVRYIMNTLGTKKHFREIMNSCLKFMKDGGCIGPIQTNIKFETLLLT
jgi:hypothetical protein